MQKILHKIIYACIISLLCVASGEAAPERIISLSPTLTEELYLLEAEDALVGVTVFCQKPPEAARKTKVGTVTDGNIEKIVTLRPDLVLTTSLTSVRTIGKLKSLGIETESFEQAKDFTEICDQLLTLGRIIGKETEAQEVIEGLKSETASVRERVEGLPKKRVFIQIGAKPLFTATKESFINSLIELAGGINVASGSQSGLYSREKVIEENPDVIIIATMGVVGEKERELWMKHEALKAVQDNKIYIVDPYKFCSATPVSFVEALKETARILHGK